MHHKLNNIYYNTTFKIYIWGVSESCALCDHLWPRNISAAFASGFSYMYVCPSVCLSHSVRLNALISKYALHRMNHFGIYTQHIHFEMWRPIEWPTAQGREGVET